MLFFLYVGRFPIKFISTNLEVVKGIHNNVGRIGRITSIFFSTIKDIVASRIYHPMAVIANICEFFFLHIGSLPVEFVSTCIEFIKGIRNNVGVIISRLGDLGGIAITTACSKEYNRKKCEQELN